VSADVVDKVLREFLIGEEPQVLALTGTWGVGKAYRWNRALEDNLSEVNPDKYCYVSLFGIRTVAELRTAIVFRTKLTNRISADQDQSEDQEELSKNKMISSCFSLWDRGSEILSRMRESPTAKSISIGLDAVAPYMLKKSIICIDDFERQSGLDIKEILGFINELKEEKKCKIALIFNSDELSEKEKYQEYKEKVVDKEIIYAPSVQDSFHLVFSRDNKNHNKIIECAQSLKIKNIRTLRKIKYFIDLLLTVSPDLHPALVDNIIWATVFLCWCAYSSEKDKPLLDEVEKWNSMLFNAYDPKSTRSLEHEKQPESVRWLKHYGFAQVDQLDIQIAKIIMQGFIADTGFEELVKELDRQEKHKEQASKLQDMWRRLRNTFSDDPEDFIQTLVSIFNTNLKSLNGSDLNAVVVILRRVEKVDLIPGLIEKFIDEHKATPSVFDLESHPFGDMIDDQMVRCSFSKVFNGLRKLPSLKESLAHLTNMNPMENEHLASMNAASVEDFKDLFLDPPPDVELSRLVKMALSFRHGEHHEIGDKAVEALKLIAQTHALNRHRVAFYGISLNDEEQDTTKDSV
jgi:hypothetical protein